MTTRSIKGSTPGVGRSQRIGKVMVQVRGPNLEIVDVVTQSQGAPRRRGAVAKAGHLRDQEVTGLEGLRLQWLGDRLRNWRKSVGSSNPITMLSANMGTNAIVHIRKLPRMSTRGCRSRRRQVQVGRRRRDKLRQHREMERAGTNTEVIREVRAGQEDTVILLPEAGVDPTDRRADHRAVTIRGRRVARIGLGLSRRFALVMDALRPPRPAPLPPFFLRRPIARKEGEAPSATQGASNRSRLA